MTALAIVYSGDCPSPAKHLAADSATVWQCTGTADEVQINAAINSVQATGQTSGSKPSGGGGSVLLVGLNFNVSSPVLLQSWVDLSGTGGRAGTQVNASAGFAGTAVIATAQTFTEMTTVHDLRVNGTGSGTEHCVYYNSQTSQTPFTYADALHTLRDCVLMSAGAAGVYYDTACRVSVIERVRIGTPGTYGLYGGGFVDSMLSDVQILGAGSVGAYCANTDTTFQGLRVDNSHTYGIHINGIRQTFVNCEVEDSTQHNWFIQTGKCVLSACSSNAAGLGSSATYDGFNINSVDSLMMKACQSYDRNGSPHQRYGVFLNGSCTNSRIECNTYGNATGSFGGTTTAGSGSSYDVFGS